MSLDAGAIVLPGFAPGSIYLKSAFKLEPGPNTPWIGMTTPRIVIHFE